MAWYHNAVFYHIYPFGELKDRNTVMRLSDLTETVVPYLRDSGFTAVYLGPVWKSLNHGYETIDYLEVDPRLGNNDDLYRFVETCHRNEIKVILETVFNHVGKDSPWSRDVFEKGRGSRYFSWFRSVRVNDGLVDSLLGRFGVRLRPPVAIGHWPGSAGELLELNLDPQEVKSYLYGIVTKWIDWFHIDGLRMDCADSLPIAFLEGLRQVTAAKKSEFYIFGELTADGVDYRERCGEGRCDGALNYRAMGGTIEALQGQNLGIWADGQEFDFGAEGRYRHLALYNFLENQDNDRVACRISKADLPLAYALMFASPGAPSVFCAGEWGVGGWVKDRSTMRVHSGSDLARGNVAEEADRKLQADIVRLISCRRENVELAERDFVKMHLECSEGVPDRDVVAFSRTSRIVCLASRLERPCDCTVHGCEDGRYRDVLNGPGEEIVVENGVLKASALPKWVRVMRRVD